MPQRAEILLTNTAIKLKIEYNRKAVTVLKSTIPAEMRNYDIETQTWTIDRSQESEVRNILEQFYPVVNRQAIRVWTDSRRFIRDVNN